MDDLNNEKLMAIKKQIEDNDADKTCLTSWRKIEESGLQGEKIFKTNFKLYLDKYYHNYELSDISNIIKNYSNKENYCIQDEIKLNYSDIKKILKNNVKLIKTEYEKQGYKIKFFSLKQNGRMIVGLGNSDIKETTMTFHHTYGLPYIPGQAIKGMLRSYIISKYYDCDEKEVLNNEEFIKIFGVENESFSKKGSEGEVVFFDAFPDVENVNIKKDIMSVHYKKYYNLEKKNDELSPPSDDEQPSLISFLTVEDAYFKFLIGYKNEYGYKIRGKDIDIEETLKGALIEFGIGAKTNVGYGYFQNS